MDTKFGTLQSKTKECHIVNWNGYNPDPNIISFSTLFQKVYGKPIDFLSNNDTDYFVSLDLKDLEWFGEDDRDKVMELVDNGEFETYHLRLMMTDIVARSIIPLGNYVVRVSW